MFHMKVVQFSIDEPLLRRIDRDPEAKKHGRSAFLRKAAAEYLQRKRERRIEESYRRAYAERPPAEGEFGPFGFPVDPWRDE